MTSYNSCIFSVGRRSILVVKLDRCDFCKWNDSKFCFCVHVCVRVHVCGGAKKKCMSAVWSQHYQNNLGEVLILVIVRTANSTFSTVWGNEGKVLVLLSLLHLSSRFSSYSRSWIIYLLGLIQYLLVYETKSHYTSGSRLQSMVRKLPRGTQ